MAHPSSLSDSSPVAPRAGVLLAHITLELEHIDDLPLVLVNLCQTGTKVQVSSSLGSTATEKLIASELVEKCLQLYTNIP